MTSTRRVGAETSETRSTLLDSTERLMLDQGYAAVTYRRVAAAAGVTAPLVQYYFPTLDDLFVALLRRRSDRNLEKLTQALEAEPETPLRVIWEYSADETSAALMVELMALGNHRKAIRAEIAEVSERSRKIQLDALAATRKNREFLGDEVSDPAVLFLLAGIPKVMLMESALGVSTGHDETLNIVKRYLNWTEPPAITTGKRRSVRKVSTPKAKSSASARKKGRKAGTGRSASKSTSSKASIKKG